MTSNNSEYESALSLYKDTIKKLIDPAFLDFKNLDRDLAMYIREIISLFLMPYVFENMIITASTTKEDFFKIYTKMYTLFIEVVLELTIDKVSLEEIYTTNIGALHSIYTGIKSNNKSTEENINISLN